MVRKFVAERCHDSSHETMTDSVQHTSSGDEEHKVIPCGSQYHKNNERICRLSQREQEAIDKLWLREFLGVGLRRRTIHDIWEAPSDGLGRRFERTIVQPLFRGNYGSGKKTSGTGRNGVESGRQSEIFIIAEHEKYLHVIHDCSYSGSNCRCVYIQRLRDYTTEEQNIEEDS